MAKNVVPALTTQNIIDWTQPIFNLQVAGQMDAAQKVCDRVEYELRTREALLKQLQVLGIYDEASFLKIMEHHCRAMKYDMVVYMMGLRLFMEVPRPQNPRSRYAGPDAKAKRQAWLAYCQNLPPTGLRMAWPNR
jgi:hypothetical protein